MLDFLVFLLSIKLSLVGSSMLIPALLHLANFYSSFMSQPRCHLLREVYLTQLPFQRTSIFVKAYSFHYQVKSILFIASHSTKY